MMHVEQFAAQYKVVGMVGMGLMMPPALAKVCYGNGYRHGFRTADVALMNDNLVTFLYIK